MKRFAKTALALLLALALAVPAWGAYSAWELPADKAAIYEQLSDEAKRVYTELDSAENQAKFRSGEDIVLTGITGTYSSQSDMERQSQRWMDAVNDAYSAILLTHPEIFWLSGITQKMSAKTDGSSFESTITIHLNFQSDWAAGGRGAADDEAAALAAAADLADEACVQGGPWDQLAYVHDWLTGHNVYNETAARQGNQVAGHLPWTPLAALTDAGQPVCEGYARAFKLVCDQLGYPCLYVVGIAVDSTGRQGRHAWNQVNVGGDWYAVDVTFDDPAVAGVSSAVSGKESHTYLLVGEETLIDDEYIFGDNHFPDGRLTETTSFTYPALAPEALDPGFTWGPPEMTGEPEPITFADVSEGDYFATAVQWAVAVDVTNGTGTDAEGNALFSPDATVTRGQAVTFLWRAMGQPEPDTEENRFQDVAADSYYEKAVLWAVENGVTNGKVWDEDGGVFLFAPDDPVTRGQMLTFLWRAMGRPGETESYEGKAWNADAERWAYAYGVAEGTAQAYSAAAPCPRSDVVYYLFHAVLLMAAE